MIVKNPSVKIFNDNEGQHVVDISLIEYVVDKKDKDGNLIFEQDGKGNVLTSTNSNGEVTNVTKKDTKGYRIKFEFTRDGWKTKRIIYLQDKEATELLSVIYGRKKSAKFQRNDPHLKFLNVENQGEHCSITFKFSTNDGKIKESFYGKATSFILFNVSTFIIALLSYEMSREQGIKLSLDNILNQVDFILPSKLSDNVSVIKSKVEEATNQEGGENQTVENSNSEVKTGGVDINKCADCGTEMDPTKYQKIIDFSNKKFHRTVCYNCQQKLK